MIEVSNNNEPRALVQWFAVEMEKKLKLNDSKEGWKNCSISELLDRLSDEVDELAVAMLMDDTFDQIISECSDVANFAMMIADIANQAKERSANDE